MNFMSPAQISDYVSLKRAHYRTLLERLCMLGDFLPSFRQNSFGIHGGFFEAGVQHYVLLLLLFEATLLKPKYTVHNGL